MHWLDCDFENMNRIGQAVDDASKPERCFAGLEVTESSQVGERAGIVKRISDTP
jgi:hypothetical protein